jgi:hypothetical protein
MIHYRTQGLLHRRLLRPSAGLNRATRTLQSRLGRKGTATPAKRRWFQWSETDGYLYPPPAHDRVRGRKDAQVKGYTIRLPGPTGMCSSFALWFPELAAGREAHR